VHWNGVYIAATGVSLPPLVQVADVVAAGNYPADDAAKTAQISVAVADPDDRAPDFAVRAARQALERAGIPPGSVGSLFYHYSIHPGVDVHNTPAYVARCLELPAGRLPFFPLSGGCHAALAAIELAASRLHTYDDAAALVTGADVAPAPVIDRWSAGAEIPLADGAAAAVLARTGRYRLVSTATVSDSALERMHRGDEAFGPGRAGPGHPIDMVRRIRDFRAAMPRDQLIQRVRQTVTACVEDALRDADLELGEIDQVVLPYVGAHIRQRTYMAWLDLTPEQVLAGAQHAQEIGHVTTSDPLISLDRITVSGDLGPGQTALVVADGSGFVCSAMVIRAHAEGDAV
jgi:3-oxoacyl-[acyl-carrier-protein] synthase III